MGYFSNRDKLQTIYNFFGIIGTGLASIFMYTYTNIGAKLSEDYLTNKLFDLHLK